MEWNIEQTDKPCGDPVTTYGPYSCRAIPKILSRDLNGEPLVVFSGGLPRANYSDKYSVSVVHGEKHVAFDFTSKVSWDVFLFFSCSLCVLSFQHLNNKINIIYLIDIC